MSGERFAAVTTGERSTAVALGERFAAGLTAAAPERSGVVSAVLARMSTPWSQAAVRSNEVAVMAMMKA